MYLDHAATTPMLGEAIAAMTAELAQLGNPSSLHNAGRRARRVVEESREQIAEAYGARPSEVVFTSGGTEADNLAVKGLYWARRAPARGGARCSSPRSSTTRCSTRRSGWPATRRRRCAGSRSTGRPAVAGHAARRHRPRPGAVAMISVMWANNEVGTIQPIAELASVARKYQIPFHTDAVQAAGQVPVNFAASGVDALTITGHKIGGPVGAGALLLARGIEPVPVMHGGGQERDVRSGTLDAPAIAAFAVAAQIAVKRRDEEAARLAALRDELIERVLAAVPDAILNGAPPGPGPPAGQRPLLLPRLRGRRPADAAGRQGHRLLHRLGLHRWRGPAQPRPARHGRRRGPRPRLPALLPRQHLDRGRRRALGAVIGEVVERARRANKS